MYPQSTLHNGVYPGYTHNLPRKKLYLILVYPECTPSLSETYPKNLSFSTVSALYPEYIRTLPQKNFVNFGLSKSYPDSIRSLPQKNFVYFGLSKSYPDSIRTISHIKTLFIYFLYCIRTLPPQKKTYFYLQNIWGIPPMYPHSIPNVSTLYPTKLKFW